MQRKRVIRSLAGLAVLVLPATAVVSLGGVAQAATGVYVNSGILQVSAAAGKANNIAVRLQGANLVVTDTGDALTAAAGCTMSGSAVSCPASGVTSVGVGANDLNDTVTISAGTRRSYIGGGAGNDVLFGGGGADSINGGPGSDRLNGGAGHDTFGSDFDPDGADAVVGGTGVDTVDYNWRDGDVRITLDGVANDGYWPADSLTTHEGDNIGADVENLSGGFGNDRLTGSDASNVLRGDFGNDWLVGGAGPDTVLGEEGQDQVEGNDGSDVVDGGDENDNVIGGEGNDVLKGGDHNDWLWGGNGNDRIDGGGGPRQPDTLFISDTDVIIGGAGTDAVDYAARDLQVRVDADNVADDGIVNERDNVRPDVENIYGGNANDILVGNSARNGLFGFGGNDVLDVRDGVGNDTADGGVGSDACYVDAGDVRPNCE